MSEETTGTQERRRKVEALLELWTMFNDVKTWKAAAVALPILWATVDKYNTMQDERRKEWIARSEARQAVQLQQFSDITNRLDRIEQQGRTP